MNESLSLESNDIDYDPHNQRTVILLSKKISELLKDSCNNDAYTIWCRIIESNIIEKELGANKEVLEKESNEKISNL